MRRLAAAFVLICYSVPSMDAAPPSGVTPDATAPSSRAKRALEGWEASPDDSNAAGKAKITSREKKLATNSFLRPFRAGHWDTVVSNARKILPRRESEEIDALSTYLHQASSITLPSILTTARIQLARSGVSNIPDPLPVEANLIGTKLQGVLDAKLRNAREVDLMSEPLEDPRDFHAYRDLTWDYHVQMNELSNAMKLAKQGHSMVRGAIRRGGRNKQQEELNALDFAQYGQDIKQLRRELTERNFEVRVNRVHYATEVLNDEAAGTKDRFFAAFVVGVDSETLAQQLKAGQDQFERPGLQSPTLVSDIQSALKQGQQAAGPLITKSRWLFAGLHWWRRGRYGAGTDAFGLLKGKLAVRNPQLRHGLMMPKTAQVPTDPMLSKKKSIPTYPRRHLNFWAYEDRVFTKSVSNRQSYDQTTSSSSSPLVNKHFDGMIDGQFW